jgi:transcriptional repressor NrdR
MNCPYCAGNSRVIDSRPISDGIRRRRECLSCHRRFTTHERTIPVEVRVIKASGRPAEAFSTKKLMRSLQRVCKGRGISATLLERIIRRVEANVIDSDKFTIPSYELVEFLLAELESVDQIAYQRLAANYLDSEGRIAVSATQVRKRTDESEQYALFEEDDDGLP